jgi:hypothetical protein
VLKKTLFEKTCQHFCRFIMMKASLDEISPQKLAHRSIQKEFHG